jgi:hypothetical protein
VLPAPNLINILRMNGNPMRPSPIPDLTAPKLALRVAEVTVFIDNSCDFGSRPPTGSGLVDTAIHDNAMLSQWFCRRVGHCIAYRDVWRLIMPTW